MKKCPYCSAELLDDAEFCLHCMRELTQKQIITLHKNKKWLLSLITICIAASTLLTIVLLIKDNNASVSSGKIEDNQSITSSSASESDVSSESSSASDVETSKDESDVDPDDTSAKPSATQNNIVGDNSSSTQGSSSSSISSSSSATTSSSDSNSSNNSDLPSEDVESETSDYIADPSLFRYKENPTGYTVFGLAHDPFRLDAIIPDTYNGVPITAVGENAFYTYTGITTAYIPKSVKTIESSAFSGCNSLTECVIPEGVEEIERFAFNSTAIEHLIIPSTVKTFSYTSPFTQMKSKTITMKCIPNTLPTLMFSNCTKLETVILPEGLSYLSVSMFLNCESLKKIELPNSILKIEQSAFMNCWRLETIDLKNTENLGNKAFADCSSLKSITFSKKIKTIGSNVFSKCSALTDIYYNGTKSEWNAISKNASWNTNEDSTEVFADYVIHCTDGDINS